MRTSEGGLCKWLGASRYRRGVFRLPFQIPLELPAVDSERCRDKIGESDRGRILVYQTILNRRFEPFVELTGKSIIIPFNKSLDSVEVCGIGGNGGSLSKVSEFSFLRSD
jgi:hypothetical protein